MNVTLKPAPAHWGPVRYYHVAPFLWEASVRVSAGGWVCAHGWCRPAARRNLRRSTGRKV